MAFSPVLPLLYDATAFRVEIGHEVPITEPVGSQSEWDTPPFLRPGEEESFDWKAYARRIFEKLPAKSKVRLDEEEALNNAPLQLWLGEHLPPAAMDLLMRDIPPKWLWDWLDDKEHLELKFKTFRGFQQTTALLKHPTIRKRLLAHFEVNRRERFALLLLWAFQSPVPAIIPVLEEEADDLLLLNRLPALARRFAPAAILLAIAYAGRPQLFRGTMQWLQDVDRARAEIEAAEDEEPPHAETATEVEVADTEAEQAEIDEATAQKLVDLEKMVAELRAELRGAKAVEKVAHTEASQAKKQDLQHVTMLTNKLKLLEKSSKEKIEELERQHDRQGRKLRAVEREKEELESANRALKKQFRLLQQHLEDERKKVAALEARLAPAPALQPEVASAEKVPAPEQKPSKKSTAPVKLTPLDETFSWNADGRPFRITPREVKRLIDANDDDAVFNIIFALEAIEQSDPTTRTRFLNRLKEAGDYYPRVLTQHTTRVLVDASNVARYETNRYGKGALASLLSMREELRKMGCFPILFIADASLRYFIDQVPKYNEMVKNGEIQVADKGIEADELLAREARKTSAYVVTNDANFYQKVSPDYAPYRITFRIFQGTVIVEPFDS